jgi:XTP/dITP diphosphohydrolase
MKLLLATTNDNKVREIRAVLTDGVELISLADVPRIPEPQETGNTFWENARQKALAYARASGLTAVGEDSGLVIAALGGAPGVKSARFLGSDTSYAQRFDEIYRRLRQRSEASRAARFVTALAVAEPDGTLLFETESFIDGEIAPAPAGTNGFGYDPIFLSPPLAKTTGQMTIEEKSAVSHRARAFRNLTHFLGQHP